LQSFAAGIDEVAIEQATAGLLKLVDANRIRGARMIDIGCGSGLHALAALRLGAAMILATDIDPVSVQTTQAVLSRHAPSGSWRAQTISVFDLSPQNAGVFDLVYSWGVLHHTGDMQTAICKAAALVKPQGLQVLALYRRTRLDAFWTAEKRWYAKASPASQSAAQWVYDKALRAASLATGKWPKLERGMEYWTNVHDWLGGYPYEAILAPELDALMRNLGFEAERVFARGLSVGLFGSGCDEYVYRRVAASGAAA
jgi:2-polyprenyl-6-hydroxyphenyl methylase/3-demethylubiquinone-9 3-methyltransferase